MSAGGKLKILHNERDSLTILNVCLFHLHQRLENVIVPFVLAPGSGSTSACLF